MHLAPPFRTGVIDLGRLLLGLVVVTLGVLFLLDAAGVLNADRAIDRWWPLVVIVAGVFTLAERHASNVRGWILTGGGVVLLLFTTDVLSDSDWNYIWPALVILAGLAIAAHWTGFTIPKAATGEEVVRATAIFGGHRVAVSAPRFRGAWLTAIFGGIKLDLRQTRMVPEGAAVNATVAFGGIDILVPKGWRISTRSTPIFGGLDDKTDHSQPLSDDAPTLRVDGVIVFGGVAVKHEE